MVSMKITNFFFDRDIVIDAMSKKERSALSKAGAFIRTRARSSMRRRKRPSPPGQPPSSHQGDLKRLIFFGYDPSAHAVVIGPVGFNQKFHFGGQLAAGVVPGVLEHGGTIGIREMETRSGRWIGVGRRLMHSGQRTRVRQAHYAPRPYMGPALLAEAGNLNKGWSASVGGG